MLKIDSGIIDEGRKKGIDTAYRTTLAGWALNSCPGFMNGTAPEKMLEQELHDGDKIEFVYGFCGV